MQNRTVQRASEPIRQSLKPIEYSDHTCPKCKKNVKSRGTFCTAGNHWIHYNCERLKTHEIEQLEKSSNTSDEYSCKICSKDTSPQTKISLYIPNVDNPSGDMFENILSEEQLQAEDEIALDICTVCEHELPLENTDVCELCDLPCHKECMVDAGSPICLFCEANGDHVDDITSDSQLNISQDIAVNDCTNTECDALQTIDKNSFINSSGRECSEIDYFLTQTQSRLGSVKKHILDSIDCNTSDHKPICIALPYDMHIGSIQKDNTDNGSKHSKVNWKKTDTDYYRTLVEQKLADLSVNGSNISSDSTKENILNFCEILTESAKESTKSSKAKTSKPKLKVWTPSISKALNDLRMAHKIWKQNGSPNDVNNEFLKHKKLCKQNFRRSIRIEQGKRYK